MGEGATPLLEGLAWVTSLLLFYYFFLSLSSQFFKMFKKKQREAFWAKKNETCQLVFGWVHKILEQIRLRASV